MYLLLREKKRVMTHGFHGGGIGLPLQPPLSELLAGQLSCDKHRTLVSQRKVVSQHVPLDAVIYNHDAASTRVANGQPVWQL